jgi:hypothetical protein
MTLTFYILYTVESAMTGTFLARNIPRRRSDHHDEDDDGVAIVKETVVVVSGGGRSGRLCLLLSFDPKTQAFGGSPVDSENR